ncbi:pilus assembly protein TadG-related protein [Aldersonia sp. NBC_00410]|uniref:Rv3654c family TadE-like protein n=1 Tax=Aldersonia sp. NBC_00410 TaxID=2975954 RepID=UPI002252237C|nr:Rv3654c family TadE-like protein [Aldersonia sp. NBC_00410]MCX5043171.1 pilus assembly protein TadG-related protein [Aldersonia sp. NBC_00410]
MGRGSPDAERGAATVFGSFAILGLLAVVLLLVHVGSVVAARHAAQSAADLAALAAAGALERGNGSACAAAQRIAAAQRARVSDCSVEQWDVVVAVVVPVALGSFGRRDARAVARAGPAAD